VYLHMLCIATVVTIAQSPESKRSQPTQPHRVSVTAAREPEVSNDGVSDAPPTLFQLHKDMRRLLKVEATTEDRTRWRATVVQLVALYGAITRDERLLTSGTLEGYRLKLRNRLKKIQTRLQREHQIESDKAQGANTLHAGGQGGSEMHSLALAGNTGTTYPATSARGGAATDYGMILVDLIERTISPEFWDVNGGPGTIVYYRQWHALVIRATPDIHRLIGGELGGLRK